MKRKVSLALVALLALISLTACSMGKPAAKDFVTHEVSGINGKGKITIDIDREGLALAAAGVSQEAYVIGKVPQKKMEHIESVYIAFDYSIEGETTNLSNGDTVTVNFHANEGLGINPSPLKIKIEGLGDGTKVTVDELKENLVFNFDGVSGKGQLSVDNLYIDEPFNYLHFEVENNGQLENGGKATVKVKNPEDLLGYDYANDRDFDYVLEEETFEIDVKGLIDVPKDTSKITNMDDIKRLIKEETKSSVYGDDKIEFLDFYYRQHIPENATINVGGWYDYHQYGQVGVLYKFTDDYNNKSTYRLSVAGNFQDEDGKFDISKAQEVSRHNFKEEYSLESILKVIENDGFVKID